MLFLLSPAKSLDYESPTPAALARRATLPEFRGRSAELIELMRGRSADEVAGLMGISADLARLNVDRYAAWSPEFTSHNSKPALLAFNGDVYGGLAAATMKSADFDWAQRHLAILSGLYGVLRPLDLLQPYRLEMGIPIANPHGKDLYAYWGNALVEYLNQRLAGQRSKVIVNLASVEYFRAVDRDSLQGRRVDCVFEDWKVDRYKIISFYAKRARGLMARYAIDHRLTSPAGLTRFDLEGYRHDPSASQPDRLVFRRHLPA